MITYCLIAGNAPAIVPCTDETQSSPSNRSPRTNSKLTEPKLLFTFDGPLAQSYLNQPENIRIPSRLTNSSTEGDRASESYDSDYKSSPGVMNSYIEGVSLNSRYKHVKISQRATTLSTSCISTASPIL